LRRTKRRVRQRPERLPHLISASARLGKKNAAPERFITRQAGQKAAPAAGPGGRRIGLFREFIRTRFVVDAGIIRLRNKGITGAMPGRACPGGTAPARLAGIRTARD